MDEQIKKKPVEDVCPGKKSTLKLADAQAQIEQASGPHYWRSLEELAGAPEFQEMLHRDSRKALPSGSIRFLAADSCA